MPPCNGAHRRTSVDASSLPEKPRAWQRAIPLHHNVNTIPTLVDATILLVDYPPFRGTMQPPVGRMRVNYEG